MHLELITKEERMQEIIPAWEVLSSGMYISMSPYWLISWWHCYKDEHLRLQIYTVWEEEELKALLPLMLETTTEGVILRFLSNSCSDYLGIAINNENLTYIDTIVDYLIKNDSWNRLYLENIEANDYRSNYFLRILLEKNFAVTIKKHDDIARIAINKPWGEFIFNKSSNIRHSYAKLEKYSSKFEFEVLKGYKKSYIDELIQVHVIRWQSVNNSSVFLDSRRREFLHLIANDFSKTGKLIIFTLRSSKRIVAYRLGFIDNNTYFDWNTSYHPDFNQYSCGKILIQKIYEYCFSNKIGNFDFMKGLERYKAEMMTDGSYLYSITGEREQLLIDYTPPKEKVIKIISNTRGVIFDLDGVVYSGNRPIVDTIKTIAHLQSLGIKVGFLTNTSAKTVDEIRSKLNRMKVCTDNVHIMTSAVATGKFLAEAKCKTCIVFGGGDSLTKEIKRHGIEVCFGRGKAPTVTDQIDIVIGYTTEFTYHDFVFCANLINKGSRLICTDKDSKFAYNGSWRPGTGWIISSLEYVTSSKAIVIGKPKATSLFYIMQEMKVDNENLLIIGDNIDTDIMVAKGMGIASCLLLGGISQRSDIAKLSSNQRPEVVVDTLLNIYNYFMEV